MLLLLQLQHTTYTMCSSNKGYKTTNLYNGIMWELKKMKKAAINERIFVQIGICVREGKVSTVLSTTHAPTHIL